MHDSGLKIDSENTKRCIERLETHRAERDDSATQSALKNLKQACTEGTNVMEPLIASAKAGATIGEMNEIMREVFGTWVSPSGV